jgi:hypothetical protein
MCGRFPSATKFGPLSPIRKSVKNVESANPQIAPLRQVRYSKNLVRKFVALHFAKLIFGPVFVIHKYKHIYPLLTALSAA